MKRVGLILFSILLAAGLAQAQVTVVGSAHDLSSGGPGSTVDTTQVCVFCHTPHQDTGALAPLWNHTPSSAGPYGAYSSDTMDHTATPLPSTGAAVSTLCMSCHDGTIAVTSLHNPPNDWTPTVTQGTGNVDGTSQKLTGSPNVGSDMTNDHPINFAIVDSTDAEIRLLAAITVPLFGAGSNEIQCASCHDPHGSPIPEDPLLTVTMAASALCTNCHIK